MYFAFNSILIILASFLSWFKTKHPAHPFILPFLVFKTKYPGHPCILPFLVQTIFPSFKGSKKIPSNAHSIAAIL